MPYQTTAELVPNEISQRPAVLGANGDAEKIRFKERSEGERPGPQVLTQKKLLLPGTNPKIDKEKEGEFTPEVFFKMSKIGVKF